MSPHKPRRKFIYKGVKALRVIFVYTDNRSPSVATVSNVVKLEEAVDATTQKPMWKTTTSGGQEYTMFKENGQAAVLRE